VFKVDSDALREAVVTDLRDDVVRILREERIPYGGLAMRDGGVELRIADAGNRQRLAGKLAPLMAAAPPAGGKIDIADRDAVRAVFESQKPDAVMHLAAESHVDRSIESSEPFIRTSDFVYAPQQQMAPWPCEAVDEVDRPAGVVPHHLPGTNTFLNEFPANYGIPTQATRGGAETMYPEYMLKMKTMTVLPRPVKKAATP